MDYDLSQVEQIRMTFQIIRDDAERLRRTADEGMADCFNLERRMQSRKSKTALSESLKAA